MLRSRAAQSVPQVLMHVHLYTNDVARAARLLLKAMDGAGELTCREFRQIFNSTDPKCWAGLVKTLVRGRSPPLLSYKVCVELINLAPALKNSTSTEFRVRSLRYILEDMPLTSFSGFGELCFLIHEAGNNTGDKATLKKLLHHFAPLILCPRLGKSVKATSEHNEILARAQVAMELLMELLTRHCHFIFRKHLPANAFSMAAAEEKGPPIVCNDAPVNSLPFIVEAPNSASASCDVTAPAQIEEEVSCQPLTPQDRSLLASIQGLEKEEPKACEPSATSQGSDLLASIRCFEKKALKARETCKAASQDSNLLASIRCFDKVALKARETCKPVATSERNGMLASIRGFDKGALKTRETCEPPSASQGSDPLASIRGFEEKASKTRENQESCERPPNVSATQRNSHLEVQSQLQATVLHNFEAQDDDELPLCCGATITVLECGDDGWWRGCLPNGDVGLFPGNHVTLVA